MELVKPAIGMIFWMTLSFILILFILKKYAWGPILGALKKREESIDEALSQAQKAREEIARLKLNNEQIINEARAERDKIIKEARDVKETIVAEAKIKAKQETEKVLRGARETIQNEKMAAITELKNQVAALSIEIAEKIMKEELKAEDKQKRLIDAAISDINMN